MKELPTSGWNWWAFLFGPLWYLTKGMLGKAVVMVVLSIVSAGWLAIPVWFYCGFKGNEDYYRHLRPKETVKFKGE